MNTKASTEVAGYFLWTTENGRFYRHKYEKSPNSSRMDNLECVVRFPLTKLELAMSLDELSAKYPLPESANG
jgi:hypothetical protein